VSRRDVLRAAEDRLAALRAETQAAVDDLQHPQVSVLAEAQHIITGPRRDAYGDVRESFEHIAVGWQVILGAPVTGTQVALCMAWLKVCRFTTAKDRDSLVDLAGYDALAARLEGIDP
jgi:hypothetical protein